MSMDWRKLRILHVVISAIVAFVGAYGGSDLIFRASVKYFVEKYPHDGLDGLAAFFYASIAFPVIWLLLFLFAMKWQHRQAWKKQEARRALEQER